MALEILENYFSNKDEVIQDLLETQGHGCLTAKDTDEADWTLETVQVDAMVVDIDMKGRSPLDWLEELSLANPELARCTIVITGRDLAAGEVLRIQAWGTSILRKPFAIQELEAAILERVGPAPSDVSLKLGEDLGRPRKPRQEKPEDEG